MLLSRRSTGCEGDVGKRSLVHDVGSGGGRRRVAPPSACGLDGDEVVGKTRVVLPGKEHDHQHAHDERGKEGVRGNAWYLLTGPTQETVGY